MTIVVNLLPSCGLILVTLMTITTHHSTPDIGFVTHVYGVDMRTNRKRVNIGPVAAVDLEINLVPESTTTDSRYLKIPGCVWHCNNLSCCPKPPHAFVNAVSCILLGRLMFLRALKCNRLSLTHLNHFASRSAFQDILIPVLDPISERYRVRWALF
jgi:hypothetical protein